MTSPQFREIALSFPDASESAHMNHPDFRTGGKIFATLGYPSAEHGMVVLPVEEQAKFIRDYPKVFAPAKGAWGKRGSTTVKLDGVEKEILQRALQVAWRSKAPKTLFS